ncbi:peptide/nickel transport system permease protein [Deinobacterium chartae]|uniref:Peptide/nickel transport system permease protein n=1 Tax=Deinobacterium chartae TaxID=521158 RepID=A0A841HXN8_9DEIO|nr:ABC transporter permease [Deinobacterium chartae]MBB6097656.1 peptide/nickel transport system permease protein [Deinobacterium chartae]
MLPFILKRLLQLIPTFLLSTVLLFTIVQAAPGDFLSQLQQNPAVRPAQIELLRKQYGLDQPAVTQYFLWLGNFLTGDLGISFARSGRPVWEVIEPRIVNSLILVGMSTVIIYAVGIWIGVYGAVRPYSIGDRIFSVLAYFGLGIPSFFFALLAIFGLLTLKQNTGWDVPISGKSSGELINATPLRQAWDVFLHALVPSVVLALRSISSESRLIRAQMLEVLGQDYIRTARAKGLNQNRTVYKHAFRNAILPLVAGLGGLVPAIVAGAGFVEVVFSWPGLTPLLLESLGNQDLYVIVSTTSLTVILYVIGNLISDLLLAVVDPRIRYA